MDNYFLIRLLFTNFVHIKVYFQSRVLKCLISFVYQNLNKKIEKKLFVHHTNSSSSKSNKKNSKKP